MPAKVGVPIQCHVGNLILWPRQHQRSELVLVDLILFSSPSVLSHRIQSAYTSFCRHLEILQAIMSKLFAFSDQLPNGSTREMNFYDSSFFKDSGKSLPTPSQVKALSKDAHTNPQPSPVIFKDSELFVKFVPYVTTAEALCLWMIKSLW